MQEDASHGNSGSYHVFSLHLFPEAVGFVHSQLTSLSVVKATVTKVSMIVFS